MIRKPVQQWLSSLFNKIQVVEDIQQTKLEQAIGFDLNGSNIRTRIHQDKSIHFEFDFNIVFRCPISFQGIGFITASLYNKKKRTHRMTLTGLESTEIVEHINNTEMIISKQVHATLDLEYNEVRTQIEYINFDDALPCHTPK